MSPSKTSSAVLGDPRWSAVLTRDTSAEGTFFYSVKTTGVYCKPSCASRAAKPENVSFHATADAAERAGYRPCKRCKPDQPPPAERHASRVAELCRLIERSDEPPLLEQLAAQVGLSPFHAHRLFKAVTGVTPRAYARAHRAERLRRAVASSTSITHAVYAAGYSSSGRFYEDANQTLGMTPSQFRDGGADLTIRAAVRACSLGQVLVAATKRGVCAILLGDDAAVLSADLMKRFPRARVVEGDGRFEALVESAVAIVDNPTSAAQLPFDVRGTAFQQRVWQALLRVPLGTTTTYTALARDIACPRAVRAVAQACAANALAVAIPCHRVIRADGHLAGYRWGIARKRALLARERKA